MARNASEAWTDLFEDGLVTLPAPVGALRFGMTIAEAAAAGHDTSNLAARISRPGARIAVAWTMPPARRIEAVLVWPKASSKQAEAALIPKWGSPVVGTTAVSSRVVYWFGDGLRSSMHQEPHALLMFEPAMSVEQFLGDQPGRLGIERVPLLGATLDQVRATFGNQLVGEKLKLPAISTGSSDTSVRLTVTNGRITGFSVISVCADQELVTTLRDGIARRFGTATDGPRLRHDGRVIAIDVGAVA